jgi:hypothetical protein
LCLANVCPSWVRNHLSKGRQIIALCYTEMAGELAALRAVVSSTVKFVLGRSPDEILQGEVVDKPLR